MGRWALNVGDHHAAASLSAALFPSEASVVPGPAVVRPPGVRVALVDSASALGALGPGRWAASIAMGILTVLGSQLTVFSAAPADKWVDAVIDAWGKKRQLHGLACLPHAASDLIAPQEFDLLIDLAGERGPTVRARKSRVQWLVYAGRLGTAPAWWRLEAMSSVFDRVCLGCLAHLSRAQTIQGGRTDGLVLLPSPDYATDKHSGGPSGLRTRYACIVAGSRWGRWVARAFQRAALVDAKLTILLKNDDPSVVAEIQAVAGDGTNVLVALDPRTRAPVLSDARHALLLEEGTDPGGMPDEVLEIARQGCVPLWSGDSAAAAVLTPGVHGRDFAGESGLIRVLHAADAGAQLQTKEGVEDCAGMISLHTPVVLRQALISLLLGGNGLLDTGLLDAPPGAVDQQATEVPVTDSAMSRVQMVPTPSRTRARPPPRARTVPRRRRFALSA